MLSDQDLMRVQELAKAMTRPVTIAVRFPLESDPFTQNMVNISRQIAGVSGNRILWEESEPWVIQDAPSLTIASEKGRNINYLAAPEGHHLEPFLEAVTRLGVSGDMTRDSGLPAQMYVFIAPKCPHCPQMVRTVLSLAVEDPSLTVYVVDALQFPDLAQRFKVRATPTTVVNETFTIVGTISQGELEARLAELRESGATTAVIASMIDSGRAEEAAELICTERKPRAVLPIYVSTEFSRRMGAMVVLEEALERDPRSLDPIVDDLIAVLSHEDAGLRGDTASLLGKIGDARAIPALKKLLHDPDPDVSEAAEEALELLE